MNGVELVTSWLTPAVIFCVLNLMIGTIFVIPGLKLRNNPPKASENDAVSPPQLVRVPSFFERVNSIKLSFSRDTVPASTVHHEDVPNRDQPRQSFFERVNSIKLSFSRDTVPASTVHHEDVPNRDQPRQSSEGNNFHVKRSKSDTGTKASASAAVMKKSASEKVQAALDEEEEGGKKLGGTDDEAVDARADDFINRFRQQLKMQRLNSLLRYREMLKNRGST